VPRHQRKINGVAFDTTVAESLPVGESKTDNINEVHMGPKDDSMQAAEINRVALSSKESGSKSSVLGRAKKTAPVETESPAVQPAVSSDTKPVAERKISLPKETPNTETVSPPEEKIHKPRKTIASTNEMLANAGEVADAISKEKTKAIGEYHFPPLSLLKKKAASSGSNTKAELESTADKLEQTLRNFGINVTVTDVTCGPTVTRYELLPEVGVRVNRITNLADDIKLNLAVTDIRIEAPIPGKAAVGIEVPNKEKVMVSFEELASSKEFHAAESKVTFCAGKDIAGNVITANIAKMPHCRDYRLR
jgi:S-DNA-T family DNA segregation ATPase FtsK/SpoIIIE